MKVHWLQHAEHENLGCIAPWLAARGDAVTCTRLQRGEALPRIETFDWLMVMGGPMNIYEYGPYPWLQAEKKLIRAAIDAGKRTLGICLGAQLIADVLGGPVTRNAQPEVGWFDITLNDSGRTSRFFRGFPPQFSAFHWHGDTFAIPPGAKHLMSSAACAHQAFEQGDSSEQVAGIQFHLEVTAADARVWLALEPTTPAPTVQSRAEILAELDRFALNNRLMIQLLDAMAS